MHPDELTIPAHLWDHPDMRRALSDRDMGAVLRHFRKYTGISQTTLGSRVGLSQPDVSAIERGTRHVTSADVLGRIADGLNIPAALLPLSHGTHTSGTDRFTPDSTPDTTRVGPAADPAHPEDDVRRRELMTGAAGIGAAAFLASSTTPATAQPLSPVRPLERALFEPPSAQPRPLTEVHAALTGGRTAFSSAQYSALGAALPALLATAEATRDQTTAAGRVRDRAHAAVARGYVLATELAIKHHSPVAWTTSDRALTAARASGDPQVIAAAARMAAITMRRAGRGTDAAQFLARTALALTEGHRGDPPPAVLDAATVLLLTAGYSAAVAGNRSTALALLDEADETLGRLTHAHHHGDGLFAHSATPAEAAMYRISTYNALRTPDDGITYARRVNPARLPTAERAARFLTDSGRMWHRIGDGPRTYAALRAIERTAPEELRRPALRTLTTDLLHSPQHLPGISGFAARHGALV
ncbi:helix-turn-helix transcriptional regulator [Streptomyces tsukubensis]|uniref:helix-turn-helix transcriptional regulator n=1 Tax=Streptomyces tsukubensis TaxID=83656 RepID=UPI00344F4CBD